MKNLLILKNAKKIIIFLYFLFFVYLRCYIIEYRHFISACQLSVKSVSFVSTFIRVYQCCIIVYQCCIIEYRHFISACQLSVKSANCVSTFIRVYQVQNVSYDLKFKHQSITHARALKRQEANYL